MTYSAHDMAQASADGFRSGAASVTVAAAQPQGAPDGVAELVGALQIARKHMRNFAWCACDIRTVDDALARFAPPPAELGKGS